MTILRIDRLTKRFSGLTALDEVSFDVRRGEIVGLIGPNGAGKSTCFNVTTGFLKPNAGSVTFDGIDICGMEPHRIAALGLVRSFQQSNAFMALSVAENIRTACYLQATSSVWSSIVKGMRFREDEAAIANAVRRIAERVGLSDELPARAADLSYGYLRKLGIAVALAARPKCLMLDEPAAGLNPTESNGLLRLIREIRGEGTSVVVVEHDMKLVMELCDRVVVLNYGKKLAEGSPIEVRNNPEVVRSYLGTRRNKGEREHAQS